MGFRAAASLDGVVVNRGGAGKRVDGVDVEEDIDNWMGYSVSIGRIPSTRRGGRMEDLQRKRMNAMLYRIRTYETWSMCASLRSFVCSSVAPMKRNPEA